MWGEPTAYLLLLESGRWDKTPARWRDLIVEVLAGMEKEAREDLALEGSNLAGVLRGIQSALRAPRLVEQVRLYLAATAKEKLEAYSKLTQCTVDELDADLRYLGCENGVVDLQTASLLPPEQGRKCLVTLSTGVAYRPDAEHPDVDMLFAHLDPQAREWFWDVMAHALHGRPSRRIYLIVGPKGGGKTQQAMAYVRSLGQYAAEPMDSALAESGGSGQHNTELSAFAHPKRVCVMDEVTTPKGRVSASLMKRLSGDGRITFRKLHQDPETRDATATLFMICNPKSMPRLHLEDEAMSDRLRELNYPRVPEDQKDVGLVERVKSREVLEAFLAQLITKAASVKPGHPPKSIPTVRQATEQRIAEDLGEIGVFAKRIRAADGVNLAVNRAWAAWCEDQGEEDAKAQRVGGITRHAFTRRLRALVPNLPIVKPVKVGGKTQRGWRGWMLGDGDETSDSELS